MPTKEEILKARRSLRSAERTADEWRYTRGHVLERNESLKSVLIELREARKPLTPYCRSGPRTGRKSNPDDIRQLNNEINRMIGRLCSMINPRSGTPRPPIKSLSYKSFHKACDEAKRSGNALWEEFVLIRTHLEHGKPIKAKSGGIFKSVNELQHEASDILRRFDEVVKNLESSWRRYAKGQQNRIESASNPHDVQDEFESAESRMVNARAAFKERRSAIKRAITTAKPAEAEQYWETHKYYQRWTVEDIIACWVEFHKREGRWPKKSDHCPSNQLPCYPQLLRTVGDRPMEKLRSYVSN